MAAVVTAWAAQAAVAADAPAWDVEGTWGPTQDLAIDTREGTWLSVDVHPRGDRLVFDLLGDIYELPIGGGDARPLTHGAAWDMQPRYSPSGDVIAITSDRGGGDNIWLLPTAGGAAKPLSEETFRLVNSPAWAPDGAFVAGRKHFSSARSLGAGEIWLYHRSKASAGVQATVKPNDQKDFGEPAFSPDGRWLYVSRDVTPGAAFEYNKDPASGIYAILRIDRHDGRVETLIAGPGGAVRPTPSPDGKRLAWIRRDRGATVLMVRDLADGSDHVLDRALDRDLQETWAIHGVYPHFAWLPDSSALVYWAGGRLWRLPEAAAREAALAGKAAPRIEIPFRVRDTRRVHAALRFPVPVGAATFPVRAVRWPTASADGAVQAWEALGALWLRDARGRRRLPTPADSLVVAPQLRRDGKAVVYASWHDARAGQLRLFDVVSGRDTVVVATAGHYQEPALSPDGRTVVWRRGGDGWLRTKRFGTDTGIWAARTSDGGGAWRVSRDGGHPHFGPEPDRVYLERRGDQDALQLWSVGLGERDERLLLTLPMAQRVVMAPDGRHVAFAEGFRPYVAPFTLAVRPQELGAASKSVPVVALASDAADFLSFSGPARLQWSVGPNVLAIDPAQPTTPTATELGWDEPAARATGTAAVVGARLLTMVPGAAADGVVEDGTVVWRDGRIVAVGPRAVTAVPAGARVFDGKGLTVLPGFIDVHAHGAQASDSVVPQRNWLDAAMLAFGVTAMHDPSHDTMTFFAAAERQRHGSLLAPRLMSTGTIVYGAKARGYFAPIDSLQDAERHLRRLQAAGAFSAKSYNQPRRSQRQQVLAAARKLGMMVVPEGGALFHHNLTQVIDGHTGIEHALPVAAVYGDVRQLWAATRVGHTPTLGVAYGGLGGENYWYAHSRVDQHARLGRFVPSFAIDPVARRPLQAPQEEWNHIRAAQFARELLRAGGMVQLGAHGQREGLAVHWELWSFVQGGMTPLEALRVGTWGGAVYLGLDRDIGSLAVGKLADLAVVEGAPDRDIRQSEQVRYTVLGGRVWEAATMAEVFPATAPAPSFWFQAPGAAGPGRGHRAHACGCGRH